MRADRGVSIVRCVTEILELGVEVGLCLEIRLFQLGLDSLCGCMFSVFIGGVVLGVTSLEVSAPDCDSMTLGSAWSNGPCSMGGKCDSFAAAAKVTFTEVRESRFVFAWVRSDEGRRITVVSSSSV